MSTEPAQSESTKIAFEKKDDRISITAKNTADKLKLFLDCKKLNPEDQGPVTAEQITALLAGVAPALIHTDIIQNIATEVSAGKIVENRRIAKGRLPQEGRDGKILLLVKKYQNSNRDGSLDFVDPRFIRTFDNVEKGAIIGRVYPPHVGTDGIDVFGSAIKPKTGKPVKVSLDKSVLLKPGEPGSGFQLLIADLAGFVTEESSKITVKEELVLSGDVGFKTGDIDFIGAVKVRGSVMKDFKINARKDIEIAEDALNATCVSQQGSIVIKGIATGTSLATVHASESASAEAIHQGTLHSSTNFRAAGKFFVTSARSVSIASKGDIEVIKEASNCTLRTGGILRMAGGHLYGGDLYTVCGAEVKIIGTKSAAETIIHLCSDIESSLEYGDLMSQLNTAITAETVLKLHLGPYAENPSRLTLLKEPLQSKQKKLYQKLLSIQSTVTQLKVQKEELLKNAKTNPTLRINYLDQLYAGVIFRAGDAELKITQDMKGPGTIEYLAEMKKFIFVELRPLECTVSCPIK